ncbi:MAG: 50S ribosomal protein L10 [Leptospirillia bacterium]
MNRAEKQSQVDSIREQFDRSSLSIVAGYEGLSVAQLTGFRSELSKVEGSFRVVKNTLARRAVEDHAAAGLNDHFKGAIGVVFAYGDPAAAAKVVKEFIKEAELFTVSAGIIEGEILDAAGVKQIADLPSREELLAKMVGSMNSPIQGIVSVLHGTMRNLVYVLSAVSKEKAA